MSLHAAHFFCCPQSICIPHTHLPHAYLLFFIPLCLSPFFTHYYWCSFLLLFLLYVWYRWPSFLLVFFTYYRTIDELTWFILNDKGFKNKFLSSACLKTSPSTKGKQQRNSKGYYRSWLLSFLTEECLRRFEGEVEASHGNLKQILVLIFNISQLLLLQSVLYKENTPLTRSLSRSLCLSL